jgi:hypothetical protein
MTKMPASVSAALVLLLLNALVWLAFAVIVAAGVHPSIPGGDQVRWTMAILSLLTAGVLSGLCVFLRKRNRVAYYLTLGLLLVTSFLTVTDQFGLSDLIVLAIMVVPLGLLIKDRAWYLQRETHLPGQG